MNAREAKRYYSIQSWKSIIQDRIDSGLKVDDYCKQNNLSRHAYYYWLRIIREESVNLLEQSSSFVEVSLSNEVSTTGANKRVLTATEPTDVQSELLISLNGISITITDNTSSLLLSRTLEVIRHSKEEWR